MIMLCSYSLPDTLRGGGKPDRKQEVGWGWGQQMNQSTRKDATQTFSEEIPEDHTELCGFHIDQGIDVRLVRCAWNSFESSVHASTPVLKHIKCKKACLTCHRSETFNIDYRKVDKLLNTPQKLSCFGMHNMHLLCSIIYCYFDYHQFFILLLLLLFLINSL